MSPHRAPADDVAAAQERAPDIADAELVVSELFTNAVEHGEGEWVRVTIDGSKPDSWLVAVTCALHDASTLPPVVREPDRWDGVNTTARSGRGLAIVKRLLHDLHVDVADRELTIRGAIARASLVPSRSHHLAPSTQHIC